MLFFSYVYETLGPKYEDVFSFFSGFFKQAKMCLLKQIFGLVVAKLYGIIILCSQQCEVIAARSLVGVGLHGHQVLLKNIECHNVVVYMWIQALWPFTVDKWTF